MEHKEAEDGAGRAKKKSKKTGETKKSGGKEGAETVGSESVGEAELELIVTPEAKSSKKSPFFGVCM